MTIFYAISYNSIIDGLVYASYLFIVSLGLTITFGVMKILNVAHGSFYAGGAYLASIAIIYLGENEYNSMFYYFSIFMAAIVAGLFFGFIIERFILRKMYGEDIHLIVLATLGFLDLRRFNSYVLPIRSCHIIRQWNLEVLK